jgi:putative ABC transport system permease protein
MIKNYFKTAIRNLLRYKGFAIINILSLTIGLIGCLVIALFVRDEKQYDKNIPDSAAIYRIYNEQHDKGIITYQAPVPPVFASFLKQNYPEVAATARILMAPDKYLLETGEKRDYEEKGLFVDSTFFQIFPIKLLRGDPATALNEPSSIIISEDLAKKYFNYENPVGKTIKLDGGAMMVKGVMAKLPDHFHLDFHYLMPLSATGIPKDRMGKWTWRQFYTYIKLRPGTDATSLQNKFQSYVKKEIYPTLTQQGSTFLPLFQPLADIHLRSSDFVYDNAIRGNETYVRGLTIIALFVLVIACFNFINLATARSFRRAKEIGVRKVIGADRKQLVLQFIGETILLSFLAVLFATVVTLFLVPSLNHFTGKAISFNPITHPALLLVLLGGAIVIGILAGIYPAIILSGFRPVQVLKSFKPVGTDMHTGVLRHALVVIQFALSALLIISSTIVYKQIKFLNKKDLGFNKDQVIYFQVRDSLATNPRLLETFKNQLKASSNIVAVTSGYGLPGDMFAGDNIKLITNEGDKDQSANVFFGDYDYLKTLGLKLVAGRDFSKNMSTDESEAFIINESAVKEFGFGTPEKALGQTIKWDKWKRDSLNPQKIGKVIGVVQDFHYKSLHEKVAASVIQIDPSVIYKVAVKLKTADTKATIGFINSVWNKFVPGYPLDYKFMDETYGAMYQSEEKLGQLLWIFTIMAIVVGCMGLFALAAFSAEQRTKEIGVRKVLGASVLSIMGLLSKRFVLLVLLSVVLAFPVAWWAMNKWLADFPYRVSIDGWIFVSTAFVAVAIALITISFQSIKAATTNPVKSLRTE